MLHNDLFLNPNNSIAFSANSDTNVGSLPYAELVSEWRQLSISRGFILNEYIVGSPARRILCVRIGAHLRKQVMITAGIHGDEPVTPWALLDIVSRGLLDPRFGYTIWCCVNPTGYEDCKRENIDGLDINRTFGTAHTSSVEANLMVSICGDSQYALVIDLHEDNESDGFYCYEASLKKGARKLGNRILERVRYAGYDLEHFVPGFDLGYSQEFLMSACRIQPGFVLLQHDGFGEIVGGGEMLTTYLLRERLTNRALTIETPGRRTWADRIAMQRVAVCSAVDGL
jgi:hypothetical protein